MDTIGYNVLYFAAVGMYLIWLFLYRKKTD